MSPSLLQAHHHRPGGIPFPHHSTAGARPNVRRWWQRNRRIIWPATECHRSDTKEGHSCCARRLECKSGPGCLWKLVRHLCTLMQWFHKRERGLRLLEFATFNDLVLANTFGHHKASRGWPWHSPNGQHHNQIDYILVMKRFRSGVNSAKTRTFPEADIGSDHALLMMTFDLRLKRISKPDTQDSSLSL